MHFIVIGWGRLFALVGLAEALSVDRRNVHRPLSDAIREAVLPYLQNLSVNANNSAWGFAYRDATTSVALCAGFSDLQSQTPCSTNDKFAWGSTTKSQTALAILQLVDQGKLALDDSIMQHAEDYLQAITFGKSSLVTLFGLQIFNVTIRHLLQMQSGITEYDNSTSRIYQNTHRTADLSPMWVLDFANHTFACAPGSCSQYSSTNYVILGLVLAKHANSSNWDRFDQRSWIPAGSHLFADMYYPIHGQCGNFTSADAARRSSTIHGYQKVHKWLSSNYSDVYDMSCLQGWTCGNLVSPTADVAEYFWRLLGPPSRNTKTAMLHESSLRDMLSFKDGVYLGQGTGSFGYGLGMMNFTSMPWGFQSGGLFYGHNGLTYGFGAQSGYNLDLGFSVTWVNNNEKWIGPHNGDSADPLYTALVDVVRLYRSIPMTSQESYI